MLDTRLSRIEVWADWYDSDKPPTTTSIRSAIEQVEKFGATIISPKKIHIHRKIDKSEITIKRNRKNEFKRYIFDRDEQTCFFCGKKGNTIEHLLPVSKGGENSYDNCVCACSKCNFLKDNMTLGEYYIKFKHKKRGSFLLRHHREKLKNMNII